MQAEKPVSKSKVTTGEAYHVWMMHVQHKGWPDHFMGGFGSNILVTTRGLPKAVWVSDCTPI